jgi:apolipoprotein N-acyltransferase
MVETSPPLLGIIRGVGMPQFISGIRSPILSVGNNRVMTLICYDMFDSAFLLRHLRDANVGMIVQLTNDGWFGNSIAPALDLGVARLRAIEHGKYIVRGADSGPSAIISPIGEVTAEAPMFEAGTLVGGVTMTTRHTLFEWWGSLPLWVGSGVALTRLRKLRAKRPLVSAASVRV